VPYLFLQDRTRQLAGFMPKNALFGSSSFFFFSLKMTHPKQFVLVASYLFFGCTRV
jgi:hypothetical protein